MRREDLVVLSHGGWRVVLSPIWGLIVETKLNDGSWKARLLETIGL